MIMTVMTTSTTMMMMMMMTTVMVEMMMMPDREVAFHRSKEESGPHRSHSLQGDYLVVVEVIMMVIMVMRTME